MQPTIASGFRPSLVPHSDWRAEAVAAYQQAAQPDCCALWRDLAARVLNLTGQRVTVDTIQHERHQQSATVTVDGVCLQLRRRALSMVRARG
jgi:hypothetical protein